MASEEEGRDVLKGMDWKAVGSVAVPDNLQQQQAVPPRKKLQRKVRQVPDYYFLPRRSIPATIALHGAICAAGVGAGMLVEVWINKKIKEDGGVVWEMDKE